MRVRVLLFHFVCESLCVCTLNEGVCNNNCFWLSRTYDTVVLFLYYYVCVYALDLFLYTVNSLFN